ncbi:MAG: GTPase [Planctomycetota bacterium]
MPPQNDEPVLIGRQSALGAGGICILQLIGKNVRQLIQPCFLSPRGRDLSRISDGDIVYGHFRDDEGDIDEVLIVRRRGDFWEINCHGGAAALSAIEDHLVGRGAVIDREAVLDRGELLGMDAVGRAAYRGLIRARTKRAARMLADQADGALSNELKGIAAAGPGVEMEARLRALVATWEYGRMLVEPRRILIAGAPNVGKSTLLNRILGYERAITSPEPGTTVDRIGDTIEIEGYPLAVSDSAGADSGWEAPSDPESGPHLIIFLLDGSRPVTEDEAALAGRCREAGRVIVAVNKSDLPRRCETSGLLKPDEAAPVFSALTGEGIDGLLSAVFEKLSPPSEPAPGSAVIFRKTWRDALRDAAGDRKKTEAAIQGIIEGSMK